MTWILLPGMDGPGDLFAPVIKELSRCGDDCVVARYPRQRVCDRAELYSIAREALPDFGDYILAAESFSGAFAVELASRKPNRMRGLVLVASFASPPVRGPLNVLGKVFAGAAMMIPPPAFLIRSLLLGRNATNDQVREVQSVIGSVRGAVLASRLKMVLRTDVSALLPEIKSPTLVTGATRDRLLSRGSTEQMHRKIPGARVEWLDAPHLALFTNARAAAEAMRRFAATLPAN